MTLLSCGLHGGKEWGLEFDGMVNVDRMVVRCCAYREVLVLCRIE